MEKDIINALATCPLFAEMDFYEIENLLDSVQYKLVTYAKKDIYGITGTPIKYADIVVKGELKAKMMGLSGKIVEVSRLTSGNMIAPAFIFSKENKLPVTVEAEETTTIFRMSAQELKRLIDTNEQIRSNYIQTLSNIQVFLTRKMRILSLLTAREKVVYFILSAAKEQGSNIVKLDKSRQEIADSFGIQKFSLLRCLSELTENGAIEVNGKTIKILDRNKMNL
ncbi:Crp/Fnr family transcriptional regulator [Prevotella disiens]